MLGVITFLYLLKWILNFDYKDFMNSYKVCPKVVCNSTSYNFNGLCLYNSTQVDDNKSILLLSQCANNQNCDFKEILYSNLKSNISCQSVNLNVYSGLKIGNLVEQDFCKVDSDCASNNCTNHICYGKLENSTCANTTECSAKTFCNKSISKCVIRKKINESCDSDENCANDGGCFNKNCTYLNSLREGTKLNYYNESRFCRSNFTLNNKTNLICEDYLNNQKPPNNLCIANISDLEGDGNCTYTTSVTKQSFNNNHCYCNINGNGFAYCRLGTNTREWSIFIVSYLANLNNDCHFYNKRRCNLTPYKNIYILDILDYFLKGRKFYPNNDCYFPSPNISLNPGNCSTTDCKVEIQNLTNPTNNNIYLKYTEIAILLIIILFL